MENAEIKTNNNYKEVVLLRCVKEKRKLRVKMISSQPFIKGANCQFPNDLRVENMYYIVRISGIKLKGKFYSVMQRDSIICKTLDILEIKQYVDMIENGTENKSNNKKRPETIYGDDDNMECIICMDCAKDSVFSPCGHYMTCSGCAANCKKCPICRADILTVFNRTEITE
jgi:hypothetical protein